MMSALRAHLGFALAGVLLGCMHVPALRTARIVGRGNLDVGLSSSATLTPRDRVGGPKDAVQASVDYGIASGADLSARLMPYGGELGARLQLVRSRDPDKGFDLAFSPSAGVRHFDAEYFINWAGRFNAEYPVTAVRVDAPLQLGLNLDPGRQLVLGGGLALERYWPGRTPSQDFVDGQVGTGVLALESIAPFHVVFADASVGLAIRIKNATVLPQLSVSSIVAHTWRGARPIEEQNDAALPRIRFSGALGLAWRFGQEGP